MRRSLHSLACFGLLGVSVALGCNGTGHKGTNGCPQNLIGEGGVCEIRISVDSVGFLPARTKQATLVGVGSSFVIRRADGTEVLRGEAQGPVTSDADAAGVYVADFSALAEPGEYFIEAGEEDAPQRSPHFRIGADAYDDALRVLMLGMYGWRCGAGVHFDFGGQRFAHAACHLHDAYESYVGGGQVIRSSVYGWHDAGDYGKYVTNGAFALGMLFEAWSQFPESLTTLSLDAIPEHGGAFPDYLAELKWELDWLLTTQFEDGAASHKVTALNFEALNILPESDTSPRYFAPKGTAATAELAAVAAMGARIYQPYDADYAATSLSAAQLAYRYLQTHPNQRPDLTAFTTGAYQLNDDSDTRLWAAVEMWESTGDAQILADAETRIRARPSVSTSWDWGNPGNLGIFTYLLSQRSGRDDQLVARVTTALRESADQIVTRSEGHAYGRSILNYFWGSNGSVARNVMNLQVAYRLFGDVRYLDASVRQIDHLFGRNVYARSQVTGIGDKPPLNPHHRPSVAYGRAFPGLLVGGAWPTARSWVDDSNTFNTNEVAINWNAALIFALAGFTSGSDRGIVTPSLDGGAEPLDAAPDAAIPAEAADEPRAVAEAADERPIAAAADASTEGSVVDEADAGAEGSMVDETEAPDADMTADPGAESGPPDDGPDASLVEDADADQE